MGGLPSSTGQLPSAADGSRIDAIPNGRSCQYQRTSWSLGRSSLHVCRVVPLSHFRALGTCASSRPAAVHPVRTLSIRRLGCPGYLRALGTCVPWFSGHWPTRIGALGTCVSPFRPLRGCVSGPSAPALPAGRGAGPLMGAGEGVSGQGFRHLRYPPLTRFPGGRPPPCLTECRCPRRGRWRPRSPVLRRAPRPSTCSGR